MSVEYHLAPEHQLPQAQQDCLYAFGWAYDHASEFGGDSSRTFSFGGSAGGALALGVAVALVENGSRSKIAGTVALVPVTLHPDNVPDRFKPAYKSYQENAKDVPFIDKAGMMYFFGMDLICTDDDWNAAHDLQMSRVPTSSKTIPRYFLGCTRTWQICLQHG